MTVFFYSSFALLSYVTTVFVFSPPFLQTNIRNRKRNRNRNSRRQNRRARHCHRNSRHRYSPTRSTIFHRIPSRTRVRTRRMTCPWVRTSRNRQFLVRLSPRVYRQKYSSSGPVSLFTPHHWRLSIIVVQIDSSTWLPCCVCCFVSMYPRTHPICIIVKPVWGNRKSTHT